MTIEYKVQSLIRDIWSLDGQICYIQGRSYAINALGRTIDIGPEEKHIGEHPIKLAKGEELP